MKKSNSYLDKSITEIHQALLDKKIKVSDLVKESLTRAKANKDNAFELILEEEALNKAYELDKEEVPKDNLLFGIPYCAKDNLSTKDIETTGGSDILKGYIPLYDASVIEFLKEKDAILIGKTTLDELAMGGTGTSGHKGIQYNPYDPKHEHLIGGSSSGSAIVVASGIVPFALGSDTGDSVRKPASYGGLVGIKPTWGLISRFGLFPFAPSLDHVGYFTRSVEDSAILLNVLAQKDNRDFTNSKRDRDDYTSYKSLNNIKGKKIAIIQEIIDSIEDKVILDAFNKTLDGLRKEGAIIDYVHMDIDLLKAIYPAYIVISSSEATSNNANLDGIKFGPSYGGNTYQEIMFNARNKGFGNLIKRRFIIGSYSLMNENQEEVFLKAQKVRRAVVNATNEIFRNYECIYAPAAPTTAPHIGSTSDKLSSTYLIADNYLAFGNFGGYPSITIPLGMEEGLPFGASLTCKPFDEVNMLYISSLIEKLTNLAYLSTITYKKEGK